MAIVTKFVITIVSKKCKAGDLGFTGSTNHADNQ